MNRNELGKEDGKGGWGTLETLRQEGHWFIPGTEGKPVCFRPRGQGRGTRAERGTDDVSRPGALWAWATALSLSVFLLRARKATERYKAGKWQGQICISKNKSLKSVTTYLYSFHSYLSIWLRNLFLLCNPLTLFLSLLSTNFHTSFKVLHSGHLLSRVLPCSLLQTSTLFRTNLHNGTS